MSMRLLSQQIELYEITDLKSYNTAESITQAACFKPDPVWPQHYS